MDLMMNELKINQVVNPKKLNERISLIGKIIHYLLHMTCLQRDHPFNQFIQGDSKVNCVFFISFLIF